ncbi:hypothetical protein YN1_3520 [Nanoarchaeota archaeon]
MNVVLDTDVLVNLFYVDQPYHEKAKEIWKKYDNIYIPEVVLFELIYFIFKKNQKIDLIKLLIYDEKVEIINNDRNDIIFAIDKNPKNYDELNDYIIPL